MYEKTTKHKEIRLFKIKLRERKRKLPNGKNDALKIHIEISFVNKNFKR